VSHDEGDFTEKEAGSRYGLLRNAVSSARSGIKKSYNKSTLVKDRAPKSLQKSLGRAGAARAWKGYQQQSHNSGGIDSLLTYPLQYAAEKVVGKAKVSKAVWKHVHGPALRADMAAGEVLSKIPLVGKTLFTQKDVVPISKTMHREVKRYSALAPLTKTVGVATPLIVAYQLDKGFRAVTNKSPHKEESQMKDSHLREKVASVMLHLQDVNKEHEKRAHALKVLYKQAELGYVRMPQNYEEIEEKLASLVKEDLVVLEKALELAGGSEKLGELGSLDHKSSGRSPVEQFQAAILGEEN